MIAGFHAINNTKGFVPVLLEARTPAKPESAQADFLSGCFQRDAADLVLRDGASI